jgi:hypothetical protein
MTTGPGAFRKASYASRAFIAASSEKIEWVLPP